MSKDRLDEYSALIWARIRDTVDALQVDELVEGSDPVQYALAAIALDRIRTQARVLAG
jgi:hypothetical protein